MNFARVIFVCVAHCLLLASPALRAAEPVAVEPGLPGYFGASLDDVARVIAKSDFVFEGVVRVDGENAEGRSADVVGKVIFQRGLFSRGEPFPRSVPFRRDISPVGLARGESSATAPFYLWAVPMNGVEVVAFARKDGKGGLTLLKAVPTSAQGVSDLLDALKLLAARENSSSEKKASGESAPASSALLAEKVLARWQAEKPADPAGDRVVAEAGPYLVISRTEGDTGICLLAKTNADGQRKVIAQDENISSQIEKLLPRSEAAALIKQMVALEIKNAGGARKRQQEIDELSGKLGKEAIAYLTPMQIEAYEAMGVKIPR